MDSISHIPVSSCRISLGVIGGVKSILLIVLSNIFCSCSVSFIVIVHVSAAYSIVGMMHVFTSSQIVFISSWLVFVACYVEYGL